jgi:hypothetical protein
MRTDRAFSELLKASWYNDEVAVIAGTMNVDQDKAHLVLCGKIGAIMKEKKCNVERAVDIYGNNWRQRK